jgi:hypothetical protein
MMPPPPALQVGSADELDPSEWQVPPHCIPIHANVTTFDWSKLSSVATFDVVMMDPPWQLATANPTRGVALGYSQLTGQQQAQEACGGGGLSAERYAASCLSSMRFGAGTTLT